MKGPQHAEQLADNPEPRLPVCLILDRSSSMSNMGRIDKLNMAVAKLKAELSDDTLASQRVELSLVTYNHEVEYVDFRSADAFEPPDLQASGGTMVCPAVNTALDLLAGHKQAYREAGMSYYRPLGVLLSGGRFENDTAEELAMVKQRLASEEKSRGLAFFAFGFEDADTDALSRITPPNRPPRSIGDAGNMAGLFEWWVSGQCGCGTRMWSSDPGELLELDDLDSYLAY